MNLVAGYIIENYTGYTASARSIAEIAQRYVEVAGEAGGSQEVDAIAREGWESAIDSDPRIGEEDHDALRGAIQFAAKLDRGQV